MLAACGGKHHEHGLDADQQRKNGRSLPDKLPQQRFESTIILDAFQVAILAEVSKIDVAQFKGPAQFDQGLIVIAQQAVAARQIVMSDSIERTEPHQPSINFQPLGMLALLGQQVAEGA